MYRVCNRSSRQFVSERTPSRQTAFRNRDQAGFTATYRQRIQDIHDNAYIQAMTLQFGKIPPYSIYFGLALHAVMQASLHASKDVPHRSSRIFTLHDLGLKAFQTSASRLCPSFVTADIWMTYNHYSPQQSSTVDL
ncbi:hypothetical protein CLF_110707 [Clonorchis sinensis]|uniref:Uncharacterized protein n=1 Tax=Clonorchis sinensis TaxID=79923 RepID=G7YTT3_CLOSI|nr:hypothetical protein CLF_110707 [Clonorchis sinensis]